jgi:hypothetical protein
MGDAMNVGLKDITNLKMGIHGCSRCTALCVGLGHIRAESGGGFIFVPVDYRDRDEC